MATDNRRARAGRNVPDPTDPANEPMPGEDPSKKTPAAKPMSPDVIAYIGTSDVVEIDAAAWRQVDVGEQTKIVWNAGNRFQVPVEHFTDDALDYLENLDDRFVRKTISLD